MNRACPRLRCATPGRVLRAKSARSQKVSPPIRVTPPHASLRGNLPYEGAIHDLLPVTSAAFDAHQQRVSRVSPEEPCI
jgi:hypothetical protein